MPKPIAMETHTSNDTLESVSGRIGNRHFMSAIFTSLQYTATDSVFHRSCCCHFHSLFRRRVSVIKTSKWIHCRWRQLQIHQKSIVASIYDHNKTAIYDRATCAVTNRYFCLTIVRIAANQDRTNIAVMVGANHWWQQQAVTLLYAIWLIVVWRATTAIVLCLKPSLAQRWCYA